MWFRQLAVDGARSPFVHRRSEAFGLCGLRRQGSHRNFIHPKGPRVTISGKNGADAHHYQEKQVRQRIEESKK
jgi:predicted RNA binding protein YcfA (HicA-like mRNA interferase family)